MMIWLEDTEQVGKSSQVQVSAELQVSVIILMRT